MDRKSTGRLGAAQEIHVKSEVRNLKGSQAVWLCFSLISSDAVYKAEKAKLNLTGGWGFTDEHNNVRQEK